MCVNDRSSIVSATSLRLTSFLKGEPLDRTKQPLPASVSMTPWLSSSA
jgi:hypothetical protein